MLRIDTSPFRGIPTLQVELAIDFVDIVVFIIAIVYALLVIGAGELARRKLKLGPNFTRKIVHLFAGGAIWTVPFYTHPWVAVLVALIFVIVLGLATGEKVGKYFSALARPEDLEQGSVRGPFWYAVSITVITAIFTFGNLVQFYFIGAAGIHIMMLGDGLSAPIGMKYGQNHMYTIFGSKRSIHGCAALFIFGFLGAVMAMLFFGAIAPGARYLAPGGQILWTYILALSLIGAGSATLIELFSPKGTDNVTVPFLSTAIMWLAFFSGLFFL